MITRGFGCKCSAIVVQPTSMLEAAIKSGCDWGVNKGQNVHHISIMGWPEELSISKGKNSDVSKFVHFSDICILKEISKIWFRCL
jgi:hypothetical protein